MQRKLLCARLFAVLALGALSLVTSSASADLILCHRANTTSPIQFDFSAPFSSCTSGWKERGWFQVNPGQCITVYHGNAANKSFMFFGIQQNELAQWGHSTFMRNIPLQGHIGGICLEAADQICSHPGQCRWSPHMWLDQSLMTDYTMYLHLRPWNNFTVSRTRQP